MLDELSWMQLRLFFCAKASPSRERTCLVSIAANGPSGRKGTKESTKRIAGLFFGVVTQFTDRVLDEFVVKNTSFYQSAE